VRTAPRTSEYTADITLQPDPVPAAVRRDRAARESFGFGISWLVAT
jgi:hypothetical protein